MKLYEVTFNNGEQYEDRYTRSLIFTDFGKAVECYNNWPYDPSRDYSYAQPSITLSMFESDKAEQPKLVIVSRDYEEPGREIADEPIEAENKATETTLGDNEALAALKAKMSE